MLARTRGLLGLATVAVFAGACAHGNAARGEAERNDMETVLQVANNNWSDMNVYLVRGALKQRLGTVSSLTTAKFKLPEHVFASPEPLRLLADPIGGAQAYLSQPLLVNPGQIVEWRLENNVALSNAFIR
jgi:hypothetical protein